MASLDGGAACAFLQPHHFNPTIGVCPSGLSTFDIRIRMEEIMPRASVTGMSFLSFYGMSRTLSMLAVLLIPSCVGITSRLLSCPACCIASALICIMLLLIAKLFQYQYIRFVQYYYDFLGSTLLYVPSKN